jgi:preprotein translocase subunit SecE
VARSRQRAKQRQAERREARLAGRQGSPGDGSRAPAREDEELREELDLAAGAPPADLGRTDSVLEHPPPHTDAGEEYAEEEFPEELEDYDEQLEEAEEIGKAPAERRRREREHPELRHRERGKVLTFLANVWAELQRVQWPNRQQLTTLTGVVLGFVLIAGGYLGLLDAIFSRLINAIL